MKHIYNAIKYIKPEQQGLILANYKFIELCDLFADNERYAKYIKDIYAVSNEYINRAIALSALHTEAFLQSMKKEEVLDPADTMCQMFDCILEEDQKRFCEGMFQKKEFFENAYKLMMDSFENASSQDTCHNCECEAKNEEIV